MRVGIEILINDLAAGMTTYAYFTGTDGSTGTVVVAFPIGYYNAVVCTGTGAGVFFG